MSSLFFYLFFYSFVEYVHLDTSTYLKAPGPFRGAEGRWRRHWGCLTRLFLREVRQCPFCL